MNQAVKKKVKKKVVKKAKKRLVRRALKRILLFTVHVGLVCLVSLLIIHRREVISLIIDKKMKEAPEWFKLVEKRIMQMKK